MSLVANYSSSESEDSDTETQQPQIQQPVQKKRGLSSLLPPPKKTKTISVEAPEFEDDEEEERETKRVKSSAGLGLADLLPAPKNHKSPVPVTKTTTDKALMPHSLARKLKGKAKQTEPIEEEKSEIIEEEEEKEEVIEEKEVEKPKKFTGSFFHIGKCYHLKVELNSLTKFCICYHCTGKALKEEPVIKTTPKKIQPTPGPMYAVEKPAAAAAAATVEEPQYAAVDAYAYDPNAMYSSDPLTNYQYQQYQQQYYEQGDQDNVGNLEGGQDVSQEKLRQEVQEGYTD